MAPHFEYEIITLKAHHASDYQYIARIGSLVRIAGATSEIVLWHEHQIPETWGLTETEAYNKLECTIKDWISAQER